MPFRIIILANKSNPYGISKDVEGLLKVFESPEYEVKVCDPLEPPVYCDLSIHLEVPVYVWMPWSTKNFFVVNPEWYLDAWNPYMSKFDQIIVKDTSVLEKFSANYVTTCINWAHPPPSKNFVYPIPTLDEFVWVLGASVNKRAYVSALVPLWKPSYPKLTITTTSPLEGLALPPNVQVVVKEFNDTLDRIQYFGQFKGQICCSRAEGFGYTAAEAELFGAFTILNSLEPYVQAYKNDYRVAFLPSRLEGAYDLGATLGALEEALDCAIEAFSTYTLKDCLSRREKHGFRWLNFSDAWKQFIVPSVCPVNMNPLPPVLKPEECPPISIVTLIYNRKAFFTLACHNIVITDYPKEKIEWILVDDSDDPLEQNSDEIVRAAGTANPLKIVYVPLAKKTPVSEKRNIGIQKASAEIILMMDDDDHYPETSFRRRVAWLTKHPWKPKAVSATTIACYDLTTAVSAVNSPPMGIPLSQRISEATLTFYKSWWAEKQFPSDVIVGEGEGFVSGREQDVLEIPPQQIIVAFSHGRNVSSRRIPKGDGVSAGCFWGFPKEFLEFVHGLAGMKVQSA
jgi:hypothetical protein